jgi:hypothetical protein
MDYCAGQRWTYRTLPGLEASRIVIGSIVTFEDNKKVICAAVSQAGGRGSDGTSTRVTIAFLPMTEAAFTATVLTPDGTDTPPSAFEDAMTAWVQDPRGLPIYTIPFDGDLDRLIARQMAEIVGPDGTNSSCDAKSNTN